MAKALHLEGMFPPEPSRFRRGFLKLVLMPMMGIGLALWFGISGSSLVIVAALFRGTGIVQRLCAGAQMGAMRRCSRRSSRYRRYWRADDAIVIELVTSA